MENISFDKILRRLKKIGKDNNIKINYTTLAMRIIDQLYNKIPTTKIDELTAEQCASMSSILPEYDTLALHIVVSNHHKNTNPSFSATMEELYNYRDLNGTHTPLVAESFIVTVRENAEYLDTLCDFSRDYLLSYFGFKTLEKSYLMHINRRIVERPQHMWLRVAIGIHGRDLENVRTTYDLMSLKKFTHATPTLFNSGTPRPQLSSCFLLSMAEDSIEGIYETISDCAKISKWSGGIGVAISKIRAKGSMIRGTNGRSNGIVPMLRVFNSTCLYVDQCFTPDTYIYTADRGPIQIQHCYAGETKIYNSEGKTEVIQNVLEHPYEGEMLELFSPAFIDTLRVTPDHPFFVFRKGRHFTMDSDGNRKSISWDDYLNMALDPEWLEAKDITEEDMIAYRIPEEPKLPDEIQQPTAEDCFIYGLLLNMGSFDEDYCEIIIYKKYKELYKEIYNYLERRFIPFTETEIFSAIRDWNKIRLRWPKTVNLIFRKMDVFNESGERRIHARWLNLPNTHIAQILRGIVVSYSTIIINHCFYYDNTSRPLIEGMRYICMRLGVLAGGNTIDNSEMYCHEDVDEKISTDVPLMYAIRIPKNEYMCQLFANEFYENSPEFNAAAETPSFYRYGDYLLTPITKSKIIQYKGTVYDLQMGEVHDYTVHGGLVHNGGGKRNGSFAIYLEPWHADVEDFLEMRTNQGDENMKARDLFYALWIPDLFMERLKADGNWTLMCPNECPGLSDVYGAEFEALYTKYEQEHRGRKTIRARDLWFQILDAQMSTGTPYLLYKDAVNRKSNQKNIGTIKSSNLCSEVVLYTDKDETAVCNLASIALPSFVVTATADKPAYYDYEELHRVAKIVTYNLNRVIDVNYYPTEKTRRSNMRHRPIGIGVQGLADVFFLMNIPFTCEEARVINRNIFETIYHAALESSMEIAKREGPYSTFQGSPASEGILQFDMWGVDPTNARYDWDDLKVQIMEHGLRNSTLLSPMPTASTSQILGFNECFEPITSNIYSRRTLAGEFILANKYLMKDLIKLGFWNEELKQNLIENDGSIQHMDFLPVEIREKYKTVWEISMRDVIDMAADRGAFICQTQSLNLWIQEPTRAKLTSMHMHGYNKGLKTGIYYLRRRAVHSVQKFTIVPQKAGGGVSEEVCEMCSS